MKTFEFSDQTKYIWSIITGWLFVALFFGGFAVIILGAIYGSGAVATFTTLGGIAMIIAGLGGLHG